MTTIAEIAAKALDKVSAKITDAVHVATLARVTQGESYDVASGTYPQIISTQTGRAVFCTVTAGPDLFPDYVFGPSDELLLLEGMASAQEGDTVTINDVARAVRAVQDLGGAGSLFYAVAR